jgi:hypothetical protein
MQRPGCVRLSGRMVTHLFQLGHLVEALGDIESVKLASKCLGSGDEGAACACPLVDYLREGRCQPLSWRSLQANEGR